MAQIKSVVNCIFYTECPSVQQLHSEMEEMQMLLNASRQQYDDLLQLVQRHTADTQRWLSNMDDKYGWVSQLSNSTVSPNNIFHVITVGLLVFLRLDFGMVIFQKASKTLIHVYMHIHVSRSEGIRLHLKFISGESGATND